MDARKRLIFLLIASVGITALPMSGQVGAAGAAVSGQPASQPASQAASQAPSDKMPVFDVASVRMSEKGDGERTSIGEWGLPRFRVTNASLQLLLCIAYGVSDSQIAGAPGWADSQTYSVDAKVEGDKGLSYEQMQPLVQQLLAERFHLKVHRETRNQQGYVLEVAQGGPKLEAALKKTSMAQIMADQLQCPSCSLATLAAILGRVTSRPVTDKTGVSGEFKIDLHYAPNDAVDSELPSIYVALREQLGLKLSSQQVPVKMLVVDQVDRTPTPD